MIMIRMLFFYHKHYRDQLSESQQKYKQLELERHMTISELNDAVTTGNKYLPISLSRLFSQPIFFMKFHSPSSLEL